MAASPASCVRSSAPSRFVHKDRQIEEEEEEEEIWLGLSGFQEQQRAALIGGLQLIMKQLLTSGTAMTGRRQTSYQPFY